MRPPPEYPRLPIFHSTFVRRRCAIAFAAGLLSAVAAFAQPVLITAPQTVGVNDTTITPTAGGPPVALASAQITVRGTTLTIDGRHAVASLKLERNLSNSAAFVTHTAGITYLNSGQTAYGMWLDVSGNVSVQGVSGTAAGSAIDATGKGFGRGAGPGAASATAGSGGAGGGAHCGSGGDGSAGPGSHAGYGSEAIPGTFGSGGGNVQQDLNGGAGGGVIVLVIGGTLTADGAISCNGGSGTTTSAGSGGGGAGGSVYVTASLIQGSGAIRANGGSGATLERAGGGGGGRVAIYGNHDFFTRALTAFGGPGLMYGGAGSLHTWPPQAANTTYFDNGGIAGATTDFSTLTTFQNLFVRGQARLSHPAGSVDGLQITVTEDCTIEADGSIDVTGRGSPAAQGPGAGPSACCTGGAGGAAHGGNGGNGSAAAGSEATYGSEPLPAESGSGGGNSGETTNGGTGGGFVIFRVQEVLTLDGLVAADGTEGLAEADRFGGGGSGGSVQVNCPNIHGVGIIRANGGSGAGVDQAGGGGGGRVELNGDPGLFTGTIAAHGGAGLVAGGAGSLHTVQFFAPTRTIFDNAGIIGAATSIASPASFSNLVVRGQARLSHAAGSLDGLNIAVSGDAIIEADGVIDVRGKGYGPGAGPGAGPTGCCSGGAGGAAHGGAGGDGTTTPGSTAPYDSESSPALLGSGGGNIGAASNGGSGGGLFLLDVQGTLTIDGTIQAGGTPGIPTGLDQFGGGGSGGSVRLAADLVEGSGQIHADGGNGADLGLAGGGGGGRIALYSCQPGPQLPLMSVDGGLGLGSGAPGSIFISQSDIGILTQPAAVSSCAGEDISIPVVAFGAAPLTYQWRKDGAPLDPQANPSAITPTLTLTNAQAADSGSYDCVVSGSCGTTTSNAASVTISGPGKALGDINCDGQVNLVDLATLLANYGSTTATLEQGDLNADQHVDLIDLAILLQHYGT